MLVDRQGTAAVAGQSLAEHLLADFWPSPIPPSEALPATELSGFRMRADMSDTLYVAISQSGTNDRHQPHRRPGSGQCVGGGDRQPTQAT